MSKSPSISPSTKPRRQTAKRQSSPRVHKKALGQNFLVDHSFLGPVLSAAEISTDDTVLEIGPGLGALTRRLVELAKQVIAVEIDPRLAATLSRKMGNPPNLQVINADARSADLSETLGGAGGYKLVANLPYCAANPILRRFLETEERKPSLLVVMVQKEVAESMVAKPGAMSLLSVAIQVYGKPRIICDVPPQAFDPPPKVNSAIVKIDIHQKPTVRREDAKGFFDVVRAGFAAPRKQLRNSLGLGLRVGSKDAQSLLERVSIDPKLRPEDLSLEEWQDLYHAVEGRVGVREK